MKIKPLGERILLKCIEDKIQVRDGIIIPDAMKEKRYLGEVVELGPKASSFLRVGDQVQLPAYSGTPVKMDGEDYILIDEDSILGKWKEN